MRSESCTVSAAEPGVCFSVENKGRDPLLLVLTVNVRPEPFHFNALPYRRMSCSIQQKTKTTEIDWKSNRMGAFQTHSDVRRCAANENAINPVSTAGSQRKFSIKCLERWQESITKTANAGKRKHYQTTTNNF